MSLVTTPVDGMLFFAAYQLGQEKQYTVSTKLLFSKTVKKDHITFCSSLPAHVVQDTHAEPIQEHLHQEWLCVYNQNASAC